MCLHLLVYHMQEDGWIKVCKEDVSELIHKYKKGMFWSPLISHLFKTRDATIPFFQIRSDPIQKILSIGQFRSDQLSFFFFFFFF